jgi:hypothetical protein
MDRITQEELIEIFGDNLPVEAWRLLGGDPVARGMTLDHVRAELRKIAAPSKYLAARLWNASGELSAHGGFDNHCRTIEEAAEILCALTDKESRTVSARIQQHQPAPTENKPAD